MYGGKTEEKGEDGKTGKTGRRDTRDGNDDTRARTIGQETRRDNEDAGGGRGLTWLLVAVVVGVVGFLFISMGGRELASKFKGSGQEYSSFLGRKRRKK